MSTIDRIRRLLREDPRTAVLLTELLGPPVGLRSPDEGATAREA